MMTWRETSISFAFFLAEDPHSTNTTVSGLSLTTRSTSSVNTSHPLFWWEPAERDRTVSVVLSNRTPS